MMPEPLQKYWNIRWYFQYRYYATEWEKFNADWNVHLTANELILSIIPELTAFFFISAFIGVFAELAEKWVQMKQVNGGGEDAESLN